MEQYIPMFENFVNEKRIFQPNDPLFWEDLDALFNVYYSNEGNFDSTEPFFEKWHALLNNTKPSDVLTLLNRLHNQSIVPKQLDFGGWLASLCYFVADSVNKTVSPIGVRFTSDMIKSGVVTSYRGVPMKFVEKEVSDLEDQQDYYKSFSLDFNTAKDLAKTGWLQNGPAKYGTLIVCSTNVRDIHVFNSKGHKYEIILKTPLRVEKTINLSSMPKPEEKKEEKQNTQSHSTTDSA